MKLHRKMIKPTKAELEILEILWEHGSLTVRQVNEAVNTYRETGYTTTLKIMQIMNEKGLVSRKEDGRSHVYTAQVRQDETRQHLVEKFLNTSFQGSAASLVMHALGSGKTTKAELKQIRKLLDELEGGKK